MKTKTCLFAIPLALGLTSSHAQDTWTQKADFGGTPRYGAADFSIGGKGYIGTGLDGSIRNDFWEYDPATNAWTQKADFGGGPRQHAVSFAIGNKGYVGTGTTGPNFTRDFWEYDPTTNTWTRKADFGGVRRFTAVGFSIGTKGYIGTGTSQSCCPVNSLKDFWEYDPATDTWIRKADFGGGIRTYATGFSVGSKGYIGTGTDNNTILYKDFWEFDPVINTWSQKADFGGTARSAATGFSIDTNGYIGLGGGDLGSKDFWEYNPTANTWTQKADFGGSARGWARGFAIGSKGYIGTGADPFGFYKDFWEYTPDNLPIVMLSATNLTFGAQLDGTRSAAQLVTLTNSGPVTLNISSIAASENFLAKNNCGSSLPAGASCTIKVAFNPSANGVLTGSVTITDDAGDSPQTIALTGIGTVVLVSPRALDFGDQAVGTTSDPLTTTITNTGSTDLHIAGVAIRGTNFGDFAETTTCGTRLVAGGSCAVNVTFTPTAKDGRHATLLIQDSGGDSPQAVHLTGTGL